MKIINISTNSSGEITLNLSDEDVALLKIRAILYVNSYNPKTCQDSGHIIRLAFRIYHNFTFLLNTKLIYDENAIYALNFLINYKHDNINA